LDTTGFENIVETKASIQSTDLLIDTRTNDEYTGAVSGSDNYNVLRDGHATGAVLFSFTDFFDGTCLKTCTAFEADLTSRGWTTGRALVAYCTAGIRSAFFWSVATHCGVPLVSNYGGSMWDYAADSSKPMTTALETSDETKTLSAGGLLLLAFIPVWMRM
jgi:thiosulfate/3-mercaptopyruvate sulfurtransferase